MRLARALARKVSAMSPILHSKRGSAFSVVGLQNRRPGVRVPPPLLILSARSRTLPQSVSRLPISVIANLKASYEGSCDASRQRRLGKQALPEGGGGQPRVR